MASIVPDSFLGGSATRLRKLKLGRIPFPGLPKLLPLSATHLVHLELYEIPDSGYIAPEAMVTCFSTLTRLELLRLGFESPRPIPESERRRTSSSTRALLPSLTSFTFERVSEYLEDIVNRIDAPQLEELKIRFFYHPTFDMFDTPRLAHFIRRMPKLNKTCNEAMVHVGGGYGSVEISPSMTTSNASFLLFDYRCRNWQGNFQLSPSVQLYTSSLPQALIHTVESLIIVIHKFSGLHWHDPSLWRELLQPFTAVKYLYLSQSSESTRMPLFLKELGEENVSELLPALQNIFLDDRQPWGLVPEDIEQFVAAQQLASHPISVSLWEEGREVLQRHKYFHD